MDHRLHPEDLHRATVTITAVAAVAAEAVATVTITAVAVVEEEDGDETDPDPGSAIATGTEEEEEDGGAAPTDGRETEPRAIGTAAEEVAGEIGGRKLATCSADNE